MQRNVYKGFTCTTNKINADYWLKLVNQETSNPYLAGSKAERYKTEKKKYSGTSGKRPPKMRRLRDGRLQQSNHGVFLP